MAVSWVEKRDKMTAGERVDALAGESAGATAGLLVDAKAALRDEQ